MCLRRFRVHFSFTFSWQQQPKKSFFSVSQQVFHAISDAPFEMSCQPAIMKVFRRGSAFTYFHLGKKHLYQ
jgi:hypothetical protein